MTAFNFKCKFIVTLIAVNICFVQTKHISPTKRFTKEDKCYETTHKQVNSCPENDADLRERAQKMKCDSYPKCHGEELVYHCVRYKTILVEVCAPRLRIICGHKTELGGCCAIFENGLGRVVIDFNITCHECPIAYYSDETSKYSTCVQKHRMHQYSTPRQVTAVETERNSSNQTVRCNSPLTHENTTHLTGNEDPKEYIHIIVYVAMIIFVSAITSICIYVYCNRKKKKRKGNTRRQVNRLLRSTFNDQCTCMCGDFQQKENEHDDKLDISKDISDSSTF